MDIYTLRILHFMPNHQQHVIKQQIKWTVHFIGVRCVFSSITIHEILIPEVTMQKTILSKMNAINFGIFLKCITKIGRIMAGNSVYQMFNKFCYLCIQNAALKLYTLENEISIGIY